MVWIDDRVLGPIRARYGEPRVLPLEIAISKAERDLIFASTRDGRRHDVTFFVLRGSEVALIQKPHYEPGLWRPPGGGIKRDETFDEGSKREALEELGVEIELDRYLVVTDVTFNYENESIPWQTHVFSATSPSATLDPVDVKEISAARWGSLDELSGPIREHLMATGRALWRYRVALHDAAIEALTGRA